MTSNETIKVVFVEDDKRVRDNFVDEVNAAEGFACVGSYPTAEAAIKEMPRGLPDVVVLDINLPGMSGIDCLRELKPKCPHARFMMLTAYEESERIFESLVAGASGYLLKRSATAELLTAIRQVYEGGAPMSSAIARRVVQYFNAQGKDASDLERLSPRERDVLELLASGAAYKKIAEKLSLSIDTVRMNVKHIYGKLQVHSRGEAVAKFLHRP